MRISVHQAGQRVRVGLVTGALAPRLIERDASSATVALAAAQMVLLDGDAVRIEIDVGADCTLELEDIGGTVAYPGRSSWEVRARVADGGRLIWRGLPFVVTDEASTRRRTEVTLAPTALLLLRDTIVLGRHHETGGAIDAGITIADDEPYLVERLAADGALPGPGVLGAHRVLDSVIAIGFRPGMQPGDLELARPGAVARHLGTDTHSSTLDSVWSRWRAELDEATRRGVSDPPEPARSTTG